ncbi:MAG: FAD-binding oxidoreductase [Ardenticatenaceae bacterium]|nr:FAD-binding oxidoreductase [Ardenticatenaceae bacterium]
MELPAVTDVAVIGGGYTGLNAARVLARANINVVVLERYTVGWGASSRNSGIVTTGNKQAIQRFFRRRGAELTQPIWRAALDAVDLVGEIIADEGLACDFRRRGHITLALKPRHVASLQAQADWFAERLGHQMQVLSAAALREEIGSDRYYGGVVDEWGATLNPAAYAYGLAQVARRYGAKICENARVTRVEWLPHGFNLYTSQGMVQAQEVVLATNGYTDGLIRPLRTTTIPVGNYSIVTEPLPPAQQEALSPNGRAFFDSRRSLHYFRLTPDGRLLLSGRTHWTLDGDPIDSAKYLCTQMAKTFPMLRDIPITHSWSGQLGMTFDGLPRLGRGAGVHYALGYNGYGVAMATYLGTELGLLLSRQKTHSPFLELPHQRKFYYRKRPWFLPMAITGLRLLDWLA